MVLRGAPTALENSKSDLRVVAALVASLGALTQNRVRVGSAAMSHASKRRQARTAVGFITGSPPQCLPVVAALTAYASDGRIRARAMRRSRERCGHLPTFLFVCHRKTGPACFACQSKFVGAPARRYSGRSRGDPTAATSHRSSAAIDWILRDCNTAHTYNTASSVSQRFRLGASRATSLARPCLIYGSSDPSPPSSSKNIAGGAAKLSVPRRKDEHPAVAPERAARFPCCIHPASARAVHIYI
ncbi:hypothetical protein HPB51_023121 [Rhipicephalus microplus]|uniref:Uncharacterized protein n=1 Tax=Rhipicephalus microplus TaxID=6941 RepID=A0A9J6DJU7_RHIMP|nr:hypothetical protein HPB51_023121 [Rhipicephalus microplus]